MKVNKKGMIERIVAIALAVFLLIGLALPFLANGMGEGSLKLGEWSDLIEMMVVTETKLIAIWQAAEVVLYFTIAVVSALAVVAVVQFFVDNKVLKLVARILAIVAVVLAVVFFALYIGYIIGYNKDVGVKAFKVAVGPVFVLIGGLGAGVAGILAARK